MTFGIESSNIVGYTTKDAPQGKFLILGAQFEGVTSGSLKINDILTGVQGVDIDIEDFTHEKTAAQIQVPFGSNYKIYYYVNDGYYATGEFDGDGEEIFDQKPGWVDGEGMITDDELTPGVAVWFKSVPGDASATVSGAVPAEDSGSITCPAGFALRANVFPVALQFNDGNLSVSGVPSVDIDIEDFTHEKTAAQIQVPFGSNYKIYYYVNDGYYATGEFDGDGEEIFDQKPGWVDGEGMITEDFIPASQGFWTKGVSKEFTLKFTK